MVFSSGEIEAQRGLRGGWKFSSRVPQKQPRQAAAVFERIRHCGEIAKSIRALQIKPVAAISDPFSIVYMGSAIGVHGKGRINRTLITLTGADQRG